MSRNFEIRRTHPARRSTTKILEGVKERIQGLQWVGDQTFTGYAFRKNFNGPPHSIAGEGVERKFRCHSPRDRQAVESKRSVAVTRRARIVLPTAIVSWQKPFA